jgi:hypothetical protein
VSYDLHYLQTHLHLNLHPLTLAPEEIPSPKLEQSNTLHIPEIMSLLQETYPYGTNSTTTKQQWSKTRNYLYQYRANSRAKSFTNTTNVLPPVKTKRVRNKNLSLENVQEIIAFLNATFPDHPELQAHILQTSPRILGQYHSIESRLIPTIEFLRGLYGKLPDSNGVEGDMIYEAIWRNTDLLLVRGVGYAGGGWVDMGASDHGSAIEEYLMEIGVSSSGVAKMKKGHPTLFQVSLAQKVKPVVHFLLMIFKHMSSTSTQKKHLSRIITNHPMLLHLDVESNLEPKVRFIQTFCDMNDEELAVVVSTTPGLLGLSLESNVKPTLQFLLNALTPDAKKTNTKQTDKPVSNESTLLRKCILKHPQILALSLSNLRAKMRYFDEIDAAGTRSAKTTHKRKDGSLASKVLLNAPSVYSLSLGNISKKMEYLAAIWTCFVPATSFNSDETDMIQSRLTELNTNCDTASLSYNIGTYPQILTLSMEGNIKVS